MDPQNKRWVTVNEFCEEFSVHPVTVRKSLSKRLLPFVKLKGIGVRIDAKLVRENLEHIEIVPKNVRR